jgi:hypothetical protein
MSSFQSVSAPAQVGDTGIDERIVLVDTFSGGWSANDVVTLPPVGSGVGFLGRILIKDIGGVADTKPIVISGGATTIDGQATQTIATPYGAMSFVYTGVEWKVI